MLTQIHELDYLNYFFSNYKLESYKYISQKISNLIIDVEDNYTSIFKFKSKLKKNISLAKVTCSYVQVPKKRTIFISCELGSLYADLNSLKIRKNYFLFWFTQSKFFNKCIISEESIDF